MVWWLSRCESREEEAVTAFEGGRKWLPSLERGVHLFLLPAARGQERESERRNRVEAR